MTYSDTNTPADGRSTIITEALNDRFPECDAVVRYAFPREGGEPKQEPKLRSIYEPIPDGAKWVSGLYFLTEDRREWLEEFEDNPYGNPGARNIAKEIQNRCERDDHVFYPLVAESDAYDGKDPVPLPMMVEWLQEFVADLLSLDPDSCTYFYSGSRSIHVHAPAFLTHDALDILRDQAKQHCEEAGVDLDTGVYKAKQQFRIPGVVHQNSGGEFRKAEIEPGSSHTEIINTAGGNVDQPETYADLLEMVFPQQKSEEAEVVSASSLTGCDRSIPTPVVEKKHYQRLYEKQRWEAYNRKEFYPYPTGDEWDGRSVASLKVLGGAFQREDIGRGRTLVPAYFFGAHACDGQEFTKYQKHAPLQLSKKDLKQWDYCQGETLVVIGGGSYRSIILEVSTSTAKRVGELLHPEEGSREDALGFLEGEGYDVGSAGSSSSTHSRTRRGAGADYDEVPPVRTLNSEAAEFQYRVEQGGTPDEELDHDERRCVANRLLTIYGWDAAWRWFENQYGANFNPERTWTGFRRIVEAWSDLDHIDVPPSPGS